MIKKVKGNLLSVQRGIIVHGCNCQGVMSSGIADSIKKAWPDVFKSYKRFYDVFGLRLGEIIPVPSLSLSSAHPRLFSPEWSTAQLPPEMIVVNAMTQFNYGRDPLVVYVDYDAISAAFAQVRILARETGLPVHFPLIGCGLANGKWEEVGSRIEAALHGLDATLWEFNP